MTGVYWSNTMKNKTQRGPVVYRGTAFLQPGDLCRDMIATCFEDKDTGFIIPGLAGESYVLRRPGAAQTEQMPHHGEQ